MARLFHLIFEVFGKADAVPDIGIASRVFQHDRPHGSDHDRRTGFLQGPRIHHRLVDLVEFPLVARDFIGQQLIDDLHVLHETRHPFLVVPIGDAHHGVGGIDGESQPQPQLQSAIGYVIHRERLARAHCRVAKRDLCDAGREFYAAGPGRDCGGVGPQVEPGTGRITPIHEVIRHAGDVESQLLDILVACKQCVPRRVRDCHCLKSQFMSHFDHHLQFGWPAKIIPPVAVAPP